MRDERGLLEALLSDGRFLLSITGLMLVLSGGFAIFQSLTGYFLPQDALGFDARQLAAAANMRVVHLMFHDRVAFGGAAIPLDSQVCSAPKNRSGALSNATPVTSTPRVPPNYDENS